MKRKIEFKKLVDLKTVIVILFVFVCMAVFSFLPTKDTFQEVVLGFFALLILPLFFIKMVLKEKVCNFGFQIKSWKGGFWFLPLSFLVAALAGYVVFEYTSFKDNYFLGNFSFTKDFWYLFTYEFLVVNFFVLLYEVFFRGFVMFYFDKKFGANSIFIQFLFFIFFLFVLGKLDLNNIFYIVTSFLAGMIAYKSRSLVYSYFFSIITLIVADIIYLKLTR